MRNKSKRNSVECYRCDTAQFRGGEQVLLGFYHTKICMDCQNEWDEFADNHPVAQELLELRFRADANAAMMFGSEYDLSPALIAIHKRQVKLKALLRVIIRQWFEDGRSTNTEADQ